MSGLPRFLVTISIFCVVNLVYSFGVSYVLTSDLGEFVETFVIMNLVFYLQLTTLPLAVKHEKALLLYRKTGDPEIRKISVRTSIRLLAVGFLFMFAGIFIAGFTTPGRNVLLEFLKMGSVIIALIGMLMGGLTLRKELERSSD